MGYADGNASNCNGRITKIDDKKKREVRKCLILKRVT
jgi:hypothetical protein